jgi:hypothetical protein
MNPSNIPIENKDQSQTPTPSSTNSYNKNIVGITPTHLLFVSSLPLCIGAYAGYKLEMNRFSSSNFETYTPGSTSSGMSLFQRVMNSNNYNTKSSYLETVSTNTEAASHTTTSINQQQAKINNALERNIKSEVSAISSANNVNASRLAIKALGIGSLLSVGGFGLLTTIVFSATGCNNLQEFIQKCQKWTPRKRKELENFLGINPKSLQHEDVKATANMTEDEEWEYIKKKYIPELLVEDSSDKQNDK